MSMNLSRTYRLAAASMALVALQACTTVQIVEKPVYDEKSFQALNTAERIKVVSALAESLAYFRKIGDTANVRAQTAYLNTYLQQIDPKALEAANMTRATLGLEDQAAKNTTFTFQITAIDQEKGTFRMAAPAPVPASGAASAPARAASAPAPAK